MTAQKKHALFSASSMDRIIACPASVMMGKDIPRSDSKYSQEGTRAHECLETFLKAGPHKQLATAAFLEKQYPLEMVMHAKAAAAFVWFNKPKDAELVAESKSALPFIDPDMGGTSDVVITEDFGVLWIMDFKHGSHPVEVEDNAQLLTYALGEAHKHDYNFEEVRLTVIQPRAFHPSGKTIRTWSTDIDRLHRFRRTLEAVAKRARGPNPPIKAGDHCFFCPAQAVCPEVSTKALKQAQIDFAPATGVMKLPKIAQLPADNQLGNLLDALDKLDVWAKAIRSHAHMRAAAGASIDGWKLVDKRATRKWKDPVKTAREAHKIWGLKAFHPIELMSPAQLEDKVDDPHWVARRVTKVSSGTTLVRAKDDRNALDPKKQLLLDYAPEKGKKK